MDRSSSQPGTDRTLPSPKVTTGPDGSRRFGGEAPPRRSGRPATTGRDRASSTGSRGFSPRTTETGTAPPEEPEDEADDASVPPPRPRRSWVWRAFWGLLITLLVGTAAAACMLAWVVKRIEAGLPSVPDLRTGYRPPQVTRVLASDGAVLAELFTERRTLVKIADLPPHVKLAVLAAEDAQFYEHRGIDYLGMARAFWVNLRNKRTRQGASTITQQVVKNLLLDSERTYSRKLREALLARRIEQELTKDEILELYLNHIYLGAGRYGIEEASRGYFGKHARELTVAEAALLAGLPAAPNSYNPRHDLEAATRRRTFVLGQLRAKNFISQATYDVAMVEPVKLAPTVTASDDLAPEVVEIARKTIRELAGEDALRRGGFVVQTTIDPKLQAAARAAVREGIASYDKRWKLQGPFPNRADLTKDGRDPKTKKKVPPQPPAFQGIPRFGHGDVYVGSVIGHDDAARVLYVDVGSIHGAVHLEPNERYNPQGLPPSTWAPVGTHLRVSLQAQPSTSAESTGPGAPSSIPSTTPEPPPGSPAPQAPQAPAPTAYVPLRLELGPEAALVSIDVRTRHVLALVGNVEAAIGGLDRASHARRQPGSTFKPFVYGAALSARKITPASMIDPTAADFGSYKPKNYEAWGHDEPVRLRDALAASINMVAVRVAQDVGPPAVIDFARAAGITSPLKPDLALALGSYEVTPIELANAYATLASQGLQAPHRLIVRIVGPDGRELALTPPPQPRRSLPQADVYVLTHLMTSVVESGTATGAKVLGRPVAGKTGTTNDSKDAWFAGFTPDTVTVSWVGYDDGKPLGPNEFGGKTALPAWVAFMKEAEKGKPPVEFPRPPGVVGIKIDPHTGLLPYPDQEDAVEEVFLSGTEPKDVAPPPSGKTESPLPKDEAPEDPWSDAGT